MIKYILKPLKEQTEFAPLCALGNFLVQNKVLQPLQEIHIPQKTVCHNPNDKLLDSLIGIMSGCSALSHINWQVRPDQALQSAFSRNSCADQSTISDTLNSFTSETVEQLRAAEEAIYSQQGQVLHHDFSKEFRLSNIYYDDLGESIFNRFSSYPLAHGCNLGAKFK